MDGCVRSQSKPSCAVIGVLMTFSSDTPSQHIACMCVHQTPHTCMQCIASTSTTHVTMITYTKRQHQCKATKPLQSWHTLQPCVCVSLFDLRTCTVSITSPCSPKHRIPHSEAARGPLAAEGDAECECCEYSTDCCSVSPMLLESSLLCDVDTRRGRIPSADTTAEAPPSTRTAACMLHRCQHA